jgi:hypothetical protein
MNEDGGFILDHSLFILFIYDSTNDTGTTSTTTTYTIIIIIAVSIAGRGG